MTQLDETDRRIILETQAGLPLTTRPFHALAERVGATPGEVMRRMERMRAEGTIRRIGAVPNHYALGYRANAMAVWDVDDAAVDALGAVVGALPFVSHCYRRERRPCWPHNLYVMVHGTNRAEVEEKVRHIAALIGPAAREHALLYSRRILKKTGLRLREASGEGG